MQQFGETERGLEARDYILDVTLCATPRVKRVIALAKNCLRPKDNLYIQIISIWNFYTAHSTCWCSGP
jgi:hypothetical protein